MHLDWVKRFVEGDSLSGVGYLGRNRVYISIRGFYNNNRVSLPREKLKFRDAEVVTYKAEGNVMLDDVRKAVSHRRCSVRDRAIILSMSQSGMDDSTLSEVFNHIAYPQLVKHFGTEDYSSWSLEKCPVKIDLVRPKNGYRYYSFLDRDAISSLKDWLNVRRSWMGNDIKIHVKVSPSRLPKSDPIFLVKGNLPIRAYLVSKIFKDVGLAAGINVRPSGKIARYRGASRRYPFHSHEVRDLLKSLARVCGVDGPVSEFFLGHKIDKLGYDKSPWKYSEYFRNEYSKMSSYLNILTQTPTPKTTNSEMEEMKKEIANLKISAAHKEKELDEKTALFEKDYQKLMKQSHVFEDLMIKWGVKAGEIEPDPVDLEDLLGPLDPKARKKLKKYLTSPRT